MITRGSYVHKPMVKFSGASRKIVFYANFSKYQVSDKKKTTHKAFSIHKTLKIKPIREFFYFHDLPQLYTVSWEPEGRYCISKVFRWEPEVRYRHRLCTAIAPFWFSKEHLWNAITPFWLSTDDTLDVKSGFRQTNMLVRLSAETITACCLLV